MIDKQHDGQQCCSWGKYNWVRATSPGYDDKLLESFELGLNEIWLLGRDILTDLDRIDNSKGDKNRIEETH